MGDVRFVAFRKSVWKSCEKLERWIQAGLGNGTTEGPATKLGPFRKFGARLVNLGMLNLVGSIVVKLQRGRNRDIGDAGYAFHA